MRPLLLAVLLSACATPGYRAADCDRFRFKGYNILACDDDSVGRHCKRDAPLTDSGAPVTYHPRACYRHGHHGRKGTLMVGRSYSRCIPHEICHAENPLNPKMCEEKYPCIGDRRTD